MYLTSVGYFVFDIISVLRVSYNGYYATFPR